MSEFTFHVTTLDERVARRIALAIAGAAESCLSPGAVALDTATELPKGVEQESAAYAPPLTVADGGQKRGGGKHGAQQRARNAKAANVTAEVVGSAGLIADIPTPVVEAQEITPLPADAKVYSTKEINDAITNLAKTKSFPVASELVKSFNVQRASELKAEQYPAVMAAIAAKLGVA